MGKPTVFVKEHDIMDCQGLLSGTVRLGRTGLPGFIVTTPAIALNPLTKGERISAIH
jgi:hypothetical protein